MLNFRKLRQDFSSSILKEGKELFDNEAVVGAKILHLDVSSIRLSSRVRGAFENVYESEVEIDRNESIAIDSNCDCTYTYDCQHIAALLYFLENNLNEIVVAYSEETDLDTHHGIDDEEKQQLRETFEEAASKEDIRKDQHYQKEVLREYVSAAKHLGASPFFLPQEVLEEDHAELAVVFNHETFHSDKQGEIQMAIRLPSRSKPLYIPNIKTFLDAIRYREPISIGGRRYFFTQFSFDQADREILIMLLHHARFPSAREERQMRTAFLDHQAIGAILSRAYDIAISSGAQMDKEVPMPCLYSGNLEEPLCFSICPAQIKCTLEYLEAPGPMLLLKPSFKIDEETAAPQEIRLYESAKPGLIYKNTYYRFQPHIRRVHLQAIPHFHEITVPEPLFGTFIENALPVLRQYAEVTNPSLIDRFVTLPYVETLKGRCVIHYLNGELEAELFFLYDNVEVPAALSKLEYDEIALFVAEEGILARNLVEERKLIEEIFEDFLFDEKEGAFPCEKREENRRIYDRYYSSHSRSHRL